MSSGRVILDRRFVPKGTIVIKEGDAAYSAYLVQSGEVGVYGRQGDKEIELARLGVGEICGEMALISDTPRSAVVRATEDSTLIVITRPEFEDKIEKSDPTIRAVVQMLIKRVKLSNDDLLDKKTNPEDLIDSVNSLYKNVGGGLDEKRFREFEYKVQPKLERFIEALQPFIK